MTAPQSAGHTVSWKEYVDAIWGEKDRALAAALASAKQAVEVAEANATTWRANANEWRAAMSDRDKLYLLKAEWQVYRDTNDKIVEELKSFQRAHEARSKTYNDGWGWLAGAIGLALAAASYFFKQ